MSSVKVFFYFGRSSRLKKHKNLLESYWFRGAFFIPIVIASIIYVINIISAQSLAPICFSAHCFSNFYNIFKVPIVVAGLALPLTGIAAAIHRSYETGLQIKTTLQKNEFEGFVKHREEFTTHLQETIDKINEFGSYEASGVKINFSLDVKKAYRIFFKNNNYSSYFLEPTAESVEYYNSVLFYFISPDSDKINNLSCNLFKVSGFFEKTQLKPISGKDVFVYNYFTNVAIPVFDNLEGCFSVDEKVASLHRSLKVYFILFFSIYEFLEIDLGFTFSEVEGLLLGRNDDLFRAVAEREWQ